MSRIKEQTLGTTEMPNYKSPNSRIIRSLRTAYDKQREKNGKKAEQIVSLKGKIRDIESNYAWKEKVLTSQKELLIPISKINYQIGSKIFAFNAVRRMTQAFESLQVRAQI